MLSEHYKPYPAQEDIDQRNTEIRAICHDINTVKTLFTDLSQIVSEQGADIDQIDFTIEETKNNVEKATKELKKAEEYQRANPFSRILLITSTTAVGTAIGGPIGALVGLKMGCIATAATGAIVGGYVGKIYYDKRM